VTLEDILADVNYNIEKIVEELRKRIQEMPEITETIEKDKIVCSRSGNDFCIIKIKKDHVEIDFVGSKTLEDPIRFSWKIKRNRKDKFDRRMHIKNMFDIDNTFGLIFQSYLSASEKNTKYKK